MGRPLLIRPAKLSRPVGAFEFIGCVRAGSQACAALRPGLSDLAPSRLKMVGRRLAGGLVPPYINPTLLNRGGRDEERSLKMPNDVVNGTTP